MQKKSVNTRKRKELLHKQKRHKEQERERKKGQTRVTERETMAERREEEDR